MTTGKVLYKQQYSRSSFLLLNDGKSYQAYVMTIIADSAYINGDISKLALTTYRKRDPTFTGVVAYFTPTGKFVSSYGYKNGTLIAPPPSSSSAIALAKPTVRSSINSVPVKIAAVAVPECIDWYWNTYENDVLVSSEYLYTTCSDVASGGSSDGSSSGGGTSPAPTPCIPPASTPPPAEAAHFNIAVAQPTPTPVGGDGDGGLPPPAPAPAPCPTETMVADTIKSPCAQVAAVISRAANAIIAAQNSTILSNTTSTGIEYGANQNVANLTGTTYVNTPITAGTSSSWTAGFTWNSTNGYTIGYSHGHPAGTGPSPADVFSLVQNLTNTTLTSAGNPSIQFYENNAQVTTETSTGNYIITITNWQAMQSLLNSAFSTQAEINTLNGEYVDDAKDYLSNNATATVGDAGAYALMTLFSSDINIYYAQPGSTNYQPLIINGVTGTDTIATINC